MTNNLKIVKLLLKWMQKNLNQKSSFTKKDIQLFFASKFTINTNGKIVQATPSAYLDYLNMFKKNIVQIRYEAQQFIDADNYVIVPFNIFIKGISEMLNQELRVISIFKFNKLGKIILWQEVFTRLHAPGS